MGVMLEFGVTLGFCLGRLVWRHFEHIVLLPQVAAPGIGEFAQDDIRRMDVALSGFADNRTLGVGTHDGEERTVPDGRRHRLHILVYLPGRFPRGGIAEWESHRLFA